MVSVLSMGGMGAGLGVAPTDWNANWRRMNRCRSSLSTGTPMLRVMKV
jgi:hypothetical protein